MKKLVAFLLSLFSVAACTESIKPIRQSTAHDAEVVYEADSTDSNDDSDAGARPDASPTGKLTFQYMNNETEVFRPSTYTVRLWLADEAADPSFAYIDGLGTGKYDHPNYTVTKPNNQRSYVRKTVKVGWYLAEFDGSGVFYKFQVTAGSNGLLCHNENSFTSVHFRGYYPSFGKIKVSWKTVPGIDATANLTLIKDGFTQKFWLYAEDGTGKYKGQFWFMPTGIYAYTIPGGTASGTVAINASGKYPNVKFF